MRAQDRYPIIVTPMKDACRDFWTARLGFQVGFDSTWFSLISDAGGAAIIAFMSPDHPSSPPGHDAFGGKGMCFELEVPDVDAAHAEVAARGVRVDYALTTEAWGQRRFGFHDPSGLWVDVVQQVEPQAGFWDRYMR